LTVRALLDAGADVELTDDPPETALRLAAAFGYPEVVDLLVATGAPAPVNHRGGRDRRPLGERSERTSEFDRACALRAASVNERLDVIDQLLAAGTPIDAEVDGHPAIYWAQERGHSSAVAHLKKRAAVA
jgi:ankyrin repeat protein